MNIRLVRAFAPGRLLGAGRALAPVPVALLTLWLAPELSAEQAAQQPGREMRHFWHVFAAYAIAWALLFGWVVSIVRRLRRLEERLER